MGQIIVCREKHGDFYYAADTDEQLSVSALEILTERWNQGYWYHDPDDDCEIANFLGDAWPGWDVDEDTRVSAINKYYEDLKEKYGDDQEILDLKSKRFKSALREYKYDRVHRKWYNEAKALVESQDVTAVATFRSGRTEPLSWHLLSERSDHEYEGVELETTRGGNHGKDC